MIVEPKIDRTDMPNGDIVITLKDFCSNPDIILEAIIFFKLFRKLPLRLLEQIKIKLDEEILDRKGISNNDR